MTPERARLYRTILVVAALALLAILIWLAHEVLAPFLIGGILAYLLLPVVRRIERLVPDRSPWQRWRRPFAILAVYALLVIAIVALVNLVVPPLLVELGEIADRAPTLVEEARLRSEQWLEQYHELVPDPIEATIERNISQFGDTVGTALRAALASSLGWLFRTVNVLLGLLVIPLWLFYVLKDEAAGRRSFYALFPPTVQADVRSIAAIVNNVLSRYIRGQLFLGLVIGTASVIALSAIGIPYALVLGLVNGIFELIPIIGPWLGAIPAVIVTLAVAPEKVGIVILFYILLQQVENLLLVPKIQGDAVDINPAILIMVLLLAGNVFGVWGLLLAVPVAAIARDVFAYLYRRFSEAAAPPAPAAPSPTAAEQLPEPVDVASRGD